MIVADTLAYCPHCQRMWANVAARTLIHRPCPALLKPRTGTKEDVARVGTLPVGRFLGDVEGVLQQLADMDEADRARDKPRIDAATVCLRVFLARELMQHVTQEKTWFCTEGEDHAPEKRQ